MKNIYTVTDIKENYITVIPQKALTLNGTSANIKVKNPKSLKLNIGSSVTIGFPKKLEALQGIVYLLIPILFSYAAYFFSPKIASLVNTTSTDKFSAMSIIVSFCIACVGIFISSRKITGIVQFQITSVIE